MISTELANDHPVVLILGGAILMTRKSDESKKLEEKIMEIIIKSSEQFLQLSSEEINYQGITDTLLEISEAKYVGFNLYDDEGIEFTTMAMSGVNEHIKKISALLGFNPIGKK